MVYLPAQSHPSYTLLQHHLPQTGPAFFLLVLPWTHFPLSFSGLILWRAWPFVPATDTFVPAALRYLTFPNIPACHLTLKSTLSFPLCFNFFLFCSAVAWTQSLCTLDKGSVTLDQGSITWHFPVLPVPFCPVVLCLPSLYTCLSVLFSLISQSLFKEAVTFEHFLSKTFRF